MFRVLPCLCAGLCLLGGLTSAQAVTEIALTVDDLPGHTGPTADRIRAAKTMLAALRKHHVRDVYGMVNGKIVHDVPTLRGVLTTWVAEEQLLGNHTYSHLDLGKVELADYLDDIRKNEPMLHELMGARDFHYFRYPYLAEGDTPEKREGARQFLILQHYQIAPVTLDFFDYRWNVPYQRCLATNDLAAIDWLKHSYLENASGAIEIARQLAQLDFGRPIKHVMLLHLNQFNAEMMDSLLTAYEQHDVKFIGLDEALCDAAYRMELDPSAPRSSYTFLNQVQQARHLDNPPAVNAIYRMLPGDKLEALCR